MSICRSFIWLCVIGLFLKPMLSLADPLSGIRVKVKVVDDHGNPVTNAIVGVGFDQGGNRWIGEIKTENVKGYSDTNGFVHAQAKCTGSVGVGVEKEGYYKSWELFYFYRLGKNHDGDWQPFDPEKHCVTAVLRKIVNPIPMYAKRVETIVPAFNAPLGYDLEKGDWVAPNGKGSICDVSFEVVRRVTSQDDYEAVLTVSVFQQGDGIQNVTISNPRGSALRLPTEVPLVGYHTNIVIKWGKKPSVGGTYGNVGDDYSPNYFFRVRSKIDDKENVVSALYGKIYGDFRVSGVLRDEARLSFAYYLNPTPNDRNVEFDPSKNLFKNLKSSEEVREP